MGEQLFDERIRLYSDPANIELPGPPATNEGVPTAAVALVRSGVLENLVYSRFWAQSKNVAPTPDVFSVD